ncbi:hypothetical protein Tco_0468866 [Tanacetum coccineum]
MGCVANVDDGEDGATTCGGDDGCVGKWLKKWGLKKMLQKSEESKAYRLYDLVSQKIIVSIDVVLDGNLRWHGKKSHNEAVLVNLDNEGGTSAGAVNDSSDDNLSNESEKED